VKARPSSSLSALFRFGSERRVQFPADELPADILALLVSCGYAVRAEDAQALDHAVRRDATNVTTATSSRSASMPKPLSTPRLSWSNATRDRLRSDMGNPLSLAWRCIPCGRVLLGDELRAAPEACHSCGAQAFSAVDPVTPIKPTFVSSEDRRRSVRR